MKLDEFVKSVLVDVESGLKEAKGSTGKNYHVELGPTGGVKFDIAVTITKSSTQTSDKKINASIVQVIGADVGATNQNKSEDNEITRIQFLVVVPKHTPQEDEAIQREAQESSRRNQVNYGI